MQLLKLARLKLEVKGGDSKNIQLTRLPLTRHFKALQKDLKEPWIEGRSKGFSWQVHPFGDIFVPYMSILSVFLYLDVLILVFYVETRRFHLGKSTSVSEGTSWKSVIEATGSATKHTHKT